MTEPALTVGASVVFNAEQLSQLITELTHQGYQLIGPKLGDGAIVYEPIESAAELPQGWRDRQQEGIYRLEKSDRPAWFDYAVGPHSWKRYLFPSRQLLWRAQQSSAQQSGGQSFTIESPADSAPPRYAFFGVRSCELHAMQIQDRVFVNNDFSDPAYQQRSSAAFIVAVNCARPADTCFCASMNTGPKAEKGFDLALTEMIDEQRHEFLVEIGSERGADLLSRLEYRNADADDIEQAAGISEQAARTMRRQMPKAAETLLKNNPEHPRWDEVAERCLACANCTMVCPTCFCTSVEDTTDLSGSQAERWRRWDSCFNNEFSYLHGGSVRTSTRAKYRQWITHKLAYWHDQFGSSGCVGCGRCITWCPVGIDITEEVAKLQAAEEDN